MGAHTIGQSPQELPHVPQQVSASIQHPVSSAYQTEFSSSPLTTTGLCLTPHPASGSVPFATSSPSIHQPSLNPSLAGPSMLPSQGVIEKAVHFPFIMIPKCV